MSVNTKGVPKEAVLAALYNNASGRGIGLMLQLLNPGSERITAEDAAACIKSNESLYFDYLNGKCLKVDLKNDNEFDPYLYDREYGEGAAESAIAPLREEYPS